MPKASLILESRRADNRAQLAGDTWTVRQFGRATTLLEPRVRPNRYLADVLAVFAEDDLVELLDPADEPLLAELVDFLSPAELEVDEPESDLPESDLPESLAGTLLEPLRLSVR